MAKVRDIYSCVVLDVHWCVDLPNVALVLIRLATVCSCRHRSYRLWDVFASKQVQAFALIVVGISALVCLIRLLVFLGYTGCRTWFGERSLGWCSDVSMLMY